MFRKIDDFLTVWDEESEAMLKVLDAVPDGALEQRVTPEGRTLGRLAWHIVQTLPEMGGRTGLRVEGPSEEEPQPSSIQEITHAFRTSAASLARAVREEWSDEDLEIEDDMYGEPWPRGKTLAAIIHHQIHHRGQMTVLMRQAGLQVPGVYGPSREEWAAYGMPPQE